MQHNQANSTLTDLCPELILVDDSLIEKALGIPDLYLQLVKEPSFRKIESFKYDYQANPVVFTLSAHEQSNEEEAENLCEAANVVVRTIKCNCCRTKCQKNYCECFKAGLACSDQCSCTECSNDETSLKSLPKRISGSGCKCQKSHCMKNYCECHSSGRQCTEDCGCIQCHNIDRWQAPENGEKLLEASTQPRKRVKREKFSREGEQEIYSIR